MTIRIGYDMPEPVEGCYFTLFVLNDVGERIFVTYSFHDSDRITFPASGVVECRIDHLPLVDGTYLIDIDFGRVDHTDIRSVDFAPRSIEFIVEQAGYFGQRPLSRNQGVIAQRTRWNHTAEDSRSDVILPDQRVAGGSGG
jgi:hypothetical protein